MSQIDYEQDRVESITQADAAKTLSDKVINLSNKVENCEKVDIDKSTAWELLKAIGRKFKNILERE